VPIEGAGERRDAAGEKVRRDNSAVERAQLESERELRLQIIRMKRGDAKDVGAIGTMTNNLAWTPPIGDADIAPSRSERIEGDGYFTLDSEWIVPALLGAVSIKGRVPEPATGRGHLSRELKRAGLPVESSDIRHRADPLVPDIAIGEIRKLESLAGFSWAVTNLPYSDLEVRAEILVKLGMRDRCSVALLVRAEWPIAKARRNLIHSHPWFHGIVQLTSRSGWVERTKDSGSPRHNFCWCVWGAQPRRGDAWIRWAGKAPPSLIGAR
jgi:hypothetical protein